MVDNTSEILYNELCIGVDPDKTPDIRLLFYKYITNSISLQDAQTECISITGTTQSIDKLSNFILQPEEQIYRQNRNEFNSLRKNNSWTSIEDQRLICAIHKYGTSNWGIIRDFVGTKRSSAQCSQRWLRSLNPLINKSHWTTSEDCKLLDAVQKYGERSWTKVAAELNGRTDCQCRYRYQQIAKKYPADLGVAAKDYISHYKSDRNSIEAEAVKAVNPPEIITKSTPDINIFDMIGDIFETQ